DLNLKLSFVPAYLFSYLYNAGIHSCTALLKRSSALHPEFYQLAGRNHVPLLLSDDAPFRKVFWPWQSRPDYSIQWQSVPRSCHPFHEIRPRHDGYYSDLNQTSSKEYKNNGLPQPHGQIIHV